LESPALSGQLRALAGGLRRAAALIEPETAAAEEAAARARTERDIEQLDDEHRALLARKLTIEIKKENDERERVDKERRDAEQARREAQERADATERRLQAEREKRARRQREEEERQRELRSATDWAETVVGAEEVTLLAGVNEDINEKLAKLQAEREALQARLTADEGLFCFIIVVVVVTFVGAHFLDVVERANYLERARRQEEIQLLKAAWQTKQVEDRAYAEQQAAAALEARKAAHQALLKAKVRLARCQAAADELRNELQSVNLCCCCC
jgi:translation initiation factor 3 subunit A